MAVVLVKKSNPITWIALVAAVAVAGAGIWWYASSEPALPELALPSSQAASDSAAAAPETAIEAPPAPLPAASVATIMAEQAAADQALEKQPFIRPFVGAIKERPSFISDMEWQMLQGVANQQASPDKELTRLVNTVRFYKQLEMWEGMAKSADVSTRQALATQLLDDVPTLLLNGDLDLPAAQKLQASLLNDVAPDPTERNRRAAAEAKRLVVPAETPAK